MLATMINIDELYRSILVVILRPENLERMKQADPATLESKQAGGLLPPPGYPFNFSVLIAYEEDEAKLIEAVQSRNFQVLLSYLERGRRFIPGKDGVENATLL